MATLGRSFFASTIAAALLLVEVVGVRSDTVPEILVENGFPKGLLPGTVTKYSLAENGKFEVTLKSACTTKIGPEDVYYKKSITGVLRYGQIKSLAGIQVREFFWVSITGIEVDKGNPDVIWFEVGFLSRSLSADFFQVPPTCNSLAQEVKDTMTFSEWLSKALGGTLVVTMPRNLDPEATRKSLQ